MKKVLLLLAISVLIGNVCLGQSVRKPINPEKEIERLNKEIKRLNEVIETLVNQLKEKNGEAEKAAQDAKNEVDKLKKQLDDANKKLQDANKKNNDLQKEIEELRAKANVGTTNDCNLGIRIFFPIDKTYLTKPDEINLEYFARVITESGMKFTVSGFADATYSSNRNDYLSTTRADNVIKWLVEKYGVDKNVLSKGETKVIEAKSGEKPEFYNSVEIKCVR